MNILLINPPRSPHNKIREFAPESVKKFIHKKLIGPPLGLLTVASAVREHQVDVLEMKGEYDLNPDTPPPTELTRKYLEKFDPDIVGITVISSEFNSSMEILKTVKEYKPEILTVAGGLHATLCPEDFYTSYVDIICPGQSAHIFNEIANAAAAKRTYESIGGILYRTDSGFIRTKNRVKNYDTTGKDYLMPDRTLIERWISTYRVGNQTDPSTYLYTSLGCPYKCTFCSIWPQQKGNYFQRDIESIIDELKDIRDYPIVRFADANTVVNIDFIDRLFSRIEEEGIKKSYIMDIRVDTAVKYPWLIEKMALNGLKVVISGFESFREKELKKYNKNLEAHLIKEAIHIFQSNNVLIRGNYVIPPDYSEDDFKAMREYASSFKVTYAGYTILTPMPGTVYYREVKDSIIDHDLAKYNFFNSVLKTKLPIEKFYNNVGNLWAVKKGKDII